MTGDHEAQSAIAPETTIVDWASRLLMAVEVSADHAAIVAECLVDADMRGVNTHGLQLLPSYVRRVQAGSIDASALPTITQLNGSFALVTGHGCIGPAAGRMAIDLAIELGSEHGTAFVGVRGSTHFGSVAHYVERAAMSGLIAIGGTNAKPTVVPFGGLRATLGTNPIAFAAQAAQGVFLLDMATSHVSMGKVIEARQEEMDIPSTWGLDAAGHATTNPHEVTALLPLGGPKGYGLALMIEVLAGVLTGAGVTESVGRLTDPLEAPQDVGHFFITVDPGRGLGAESFLTRLSSLWAHLKSVPSAPGFEGVYLPGEREAARRDHARRNGVALAESVAGPLRALSQELGVDVPGPLRVP